MGDRPILKIYFYVDFLTKIMENLYMTFDPNITHEHSTVPQYQFMVPNGKKRF